MSAESDFFESNVTIPNFFDTLLFKFRDRKSNPDRLPVNGIMCFCGEQGSGKTLCAVRYVYNLVNSYPNAILCTNLTFSCSLPCEVVPYSGVEQMISLNNGEFGVIFLIDEMHLEFNSLESKGMDAHTFELVSQQRKARKHIVGTSQVFGRLAKPFREQFKYAILCKNFFGAVFVQDVFRARNVAYEDDIKTELDFYVRKSFFASPSYFGMYDTSEIIKRVNNRGFNGT